jgi:hypothetical protein
MLSSFSSLAPDAKIWIYYSVNPLNLSQKQQLEPVFNNFCSSWTAHNQNLLTAWKWEGNHFLILAVDEAEAGASGCSIDKSVALLKDINSTIGINFLDRNSVPYQNPEGETHFVKLAEIKQKIEQGILNENTLLFKTWATKKQDFESNSLIKLSETWAKRYINAVIH